MKPVKIKVEKVLKDKIKEHKHSYILKDLPKEIEDSIDYVEIEEHPGAIMGRVIFKKDNKPPEPPGPKKTLFDKNNDAPEVKR